MPSSRATSIRSSDPAALVAAAPAVEFRARRPAPPLDAFVECLWSVRGRGPYRRAQVLPNGALQLMLNFGAPHRVLGYGSRVVDEAHRRAWVAGLQLQPLEIEAPEVTDLFAVRFRPGGAHAFLQLPLHAVNDQVVAADALLGAAATELHERLLAAPSGAARIAAAEAWLLARLAPREPGQGLVQRALRALAEPAPGRPVAQLCDELGLSNKHLIDLFRRHVGLAPKALARVQRFHRALAALAAGQAGTEVAHALGYADQSHFVHEFRRLAGVTPGDFLRRRGDDGESLVMPG